MGLALHNYHDAHKRLPAFRSGPLQGNTGRYLWSAHSYAINMLPFLEQTTRFETIYGEWLLSWEDHPVYKEPVATFLCPSDGNANERVYEGMDYGNPGNRTRINYMASFGDAIRGTYESGTQVRGLFGGFEKWNTLGSIVDGTSNTIAFGESVTYKTLTGTDIKGNIAFVADLVADGTPLTRASCAGIRVPNNPNTFPEDARNEMEPTRGSSWRGTPPQTAFNTALPPNAPSCSGIHFQDGPGPRYPKAANCILTATSNHTGGVNVAMGDGSVQFVSDTISHGNLNDGDVVSGRSNFGVWGALGSIDGGESVSL